MIFKSPHPAVSIPEIPLTHYVLRRAVELGDKPALIDGPTGRTYTYGELPGYVNRLAAGLADHGFHKGNVLAIFSPNLPEYALAFYAAATLGGAAGMVAAHRNPRPRSDAICRHPRGRRRTLAAYNIPTGRSDVVRRHPQVARSCTEPALGSATEDPT